MGEGGRGGGREEGRGEGSVSKEGVGMRGKQKNLGK